MLKEDIPENGGKKNNILSPEQAGRQLCQMFLHYPRSMFINILPANISHVLFYFM